MNISPAIRVAILAAVALTGLSACSDKGKLREPAKLTSINNPGVKLDTVWSERLGKGADDRPSGLRPALESDALFVAETGGKVFALDPATGARRWETASKARIISGPTALGDLVLVGTLDAEVIAFKRADGKEAWRAKASSEVLAAPAGDGNTVVARSTDGRVYGFNSADGKRLWSFDRSEPTLTLRGLSSPVVDGNRVFIGMDNGHLACVNLATGEAIWEQVISTPNGRSELERLTDIDASMLSTDDGLLVASYGGDVALVNPSDGEAKWKRAIKSDAGMALGQGNVYVSDADGVVWALDAASGAAVWKNESLKFRHLSPPAFFAGYAVVADYDGYVHFLNIKDGSFAGRERLSWHAVAAPMVASETMLYVQNLEGKLTALRVVK